MKIWHVFERGGTYRVGYFAFILIGWVTRWYRKPYLRYNAVYCTSIKDEAVRLARDLNKDEIELEVFKKDKWKLVV